MKFFEKYLKVYNHEIPRFLWLSIIFFFAFFVTAIFRNYVDTAFLKRYGPDYIPWMLVISAILTMIVLAFTDKIAKKFSDSYLVILMFGGYALSAVLCWGMVKLHYQIVYPILYQLMGLLDAIQLVYLWNIAGDLFDARQSKRIFPQITAAQVLGTTVGSFLTRPITAGIGEDAALIVFAVVFLGTAVFMVLTTRKFIGDPRPKTGAIQKLAEKKRLVEIPGIMKEFPIIRFLIICGLIPNVLLPIFLISIQCHSGEQFYIRARSHYVFECVPRSHHIRHILNFVICRPPVFRNGLTQCFLGTNRSILQSFLPGFLPFSIFTLQLMGNFLLFSFNEPLQVLSTRSCLTSFRRLL